MRGQAGLEAYRGEGRAFHLCLGSGSAVEGRVPRVWLTVIVTLGPGPGRELFFGTSTPCSRQTGPVRMSLFSCFKKKMFFPLHIWTVAHTSSYL